MIGVKGAGMHWLAFGPYTYLGPTHERNNMRFTRYTGTCMNHPALLTRHFFAESRPVRAVQELDWHAPFAVHAVPALYLLCRH